MNHIGTLIIAILLSGMLFSCQPERKQADISLIPLPVKLEMAEGSFTISPRTPLIYQQQELESLSAYATALWGGYLQFELEAAFDPAPGEKPAVTLALNAELDGELGDEGYTLEIRPEGITIKANRAAGILYGVQTLHQLLSTHAGGKLPGLRIRDYPRFSYRGLHLDVSRHFMPIEFIYKMIDQMAQHKLNRFHWHLVDDQGWRLEIKQYPKLTEVGAWRPDWSGQHWNARPSANTPTDTVYGGYYTQEQVKSLVAYAAERNITIMPEIEMPAHVMSALAAYPALSCSGEALGVPPGGVWPITHIYCAGKEETFVFLEGVLTEVMALFPSTYIHIGGDEADKANWKSCAQCQARIRAEGLSGEEELQSYFIARIERFLNAHGRRLIGWDEILEGGLAPNASVMSWRGEEGGIAAAKMGHSVVMTPGTHCYFDHYQGDPDMEPLAIGGYTTLAKVYAYEPIPAALTAEEGQLVLGAQANVWTEYMPVPEQVEYMVFPRLAALSEVLWSPAAQRDWGSFSRRMQAQYARYGQQGVNYSLSAFQVKALPEVDQHNRSLQIALETEVFEPSIRYTLDGAEPDAQSPLYTGPFEIKQTATVKAAIFEDGQSRQQVMSREYVLHQAFAAEIKLQYPNSPRYDAQGAYGLVNGIRGSKSFGDGNWKGFESNDLVATIDLGVPANIRRITMDALQTAASWIFLPQWVAFEVSADGQDFRLLEKVANASDIYDNEPQIKFFSTETSAENIRYIRVTAKNQGVCPPGHAGEGKPAWLFVSEIWVE